MVHQAGATFQGGIDAYSLAPMQAGMLFHAAQGLGGVDVQQVICELPEAIDAAACRQAWRAAARRHAVLRTGFDWAPSGEARQVINPATAFELPFASVVHDSDHAARRGLFEYLASDRAAGFSSLQQPLLRVALISSPAAVSWLVVTYHHLLLDARSLAVLFREVFDRPEDPRSDALADSPEGPAYRNFVDWIGQQDFAAALPFWRDYLSGVVTATPAPGARASVERPAATSGVGELMVRLSPARTAQLRAVAQREEVTLNTLAQAAWALVLHRYTDADDVVFGAVRAGRHVPVAGADSLVGLLINTVPVRARFAPELRLGTWLRELRAAWVAMRPYEHTPLALVQRCSGVPAERRLFETLLNVQDPAWDETLRALGGKWTHRHFDMRSQPNYPLALDVYAGGALTIKCFYDSEVYAAATVAEILGHFQAALSGLAVAGSEFVRDLPFFSAREGAQLVALGQGDRVAGPDSSGVPSAIDRHARVRPDSVAVSDASLELTYHDLNTRANHLAQQLRALGVTKDVPVAVCMERSAAMIVAWLAVWKARGAYVPLDPAYPAERLQFQLNDCGAAVVLVTAGAAGAIEALAPATRVLGVSAVGPLPTEPEPAVASEPQPTDLAYIIYTSGSTGQPKGVAVEHGALSNLVAWHQHTYQVTAADRATQVASPAFDAAVWEVWPYLAAGASVHIPTEETRLSPAGLGRWFADQRITLSFLPTPLAEAFLREPVAAGLALRALLTGGDRLQRRPAEEFPARLVNHYGPTECTVVATAADVAAGTAPTLPAIGRPIANTEAYVLDSHQRLVPFGITGELYLGGAGLARGYWRRDVLTAEKFVEIALIPGAAPRRLYRTGDLVRWNRANELEFVGRVDRQVKIRGYRIELGEVEAALQSHPEVRESLVMTRPDHRGEATLVAYLIFQDAAKSGIEADVVRHLRTLLPAAMIPAALVNLKAWPLTVNGKIDREALPPPLVATGVSGASEPELRTATERLVAAAWSAVLECPVVGDHDHFFDLGGHSLLAAQVVARVNAALATSVSVRVLFDHPTFSEFTRAIEAVRRSAVAPPRAGPARLKSRRARATLELTPPHSLSSWL